mmetsp:Transcript_11030/g.18452  ORF Transcript_11030/g.18452 Transcript_11030/m.18452 type:complete len:236 (-) Transcript_11030:1347-2054(-)
MLPARSTPLAPRSPPRRLPPGLLGALPPLWLASSCDGDGAELCDRDRPERVFNERTNPPNERRDADNGIPPLDMAKFEACAGDLLRGTAIDCAKRRSVGGVSPRALMSPLASSLDSEPSRCAPGDVDMVRSGEPGVSVDTRDSAVLSFLRRRRREPPLDVSPPPVNSCSSARSASESLRCFSPLPLAVTESRRLPAASTVCARSTPLPGSASKYASHNVLNGNVHCAARSCVFKA